MYGCVYTHTHTIYICVDVQIGLWFRRFTLPKLTSNATWPVSKFHQALGGPVHSVQFYVSLVASMSAQP